jgi:hypothetical protein
VTLLLVILALWIGSAMLVIPYLFHVAKLQAGQGVTQSAELGGQLPAECDGSTGIESALVGLPLLGPTPLDAGQRGAEFRNTPELADA